MVVLGLLEPTCNPVALCYAFSTSVPSLPVTLFLKIGLKSLPKDATHRTLQRAVPSSPFLPALAQAGMAVSAPSAILATSSEPCIAGSF